MSTFSPVGSWSSNGMRISVCVCVCGRNELDVLTTLAYSHVICQFIPYYASAIHKHTHTLILKPSEDSEPTGLKVDIAESHPQKYGKTVQLCSVSFRCATKPCPCQLFRFCRLRFRFPEVDDVVPVSSTGEYLAVSRLRPTSACPPL